MNALVWSRFQFGFTITYRYLFPQLTMGLALMIRRSAWQSDGALPACGACGDGGETPDRGVSRVGWIKQCEEG